MYLRVLYQHLYPHKISCRSYSSISLQSITVYVFISLNNRLDATQNNQVNTCVNVRARALSCAHSLTRDRDKQRKQANNNNILFILLEWFTNIAS